MFTPQRKRVLIGTVNTNKSVETVMVTGTKGLAILKRFKKRARVDGWLVGIVNDISNPLTIGYVLGRDCNEWGACALCIMQRVRSLGDAPETW